MGHGLRALLFNRSFFLKMVDVWEAGKEVPCPRMHAVLHLRFDCRSWLPRIGMLAVLREGFLNL